MSKNSIGRMRNARINQARKHALVVCNELESLQGHSASETIVSGEIFATIRKRLEHLNQCFHEASAYNNAMEVKSNVLVK